MRKILFSILMVILSCLSSTVFAETNRKQDNQDQQRQEEQRQEKQRQEKQRQEKQRLNQQRQDQLRQDQQRQDQQRQEEQRQDQQRQDQQRQDQLRRDQQRQDQLRRDQQRQDQLRRDQQRHYDWSHQAYRNDNWRRSEIRADESLPFRWREHRDRYRGERIDDNDWNGRFPGLHSYKWHGDDFWYRGRHIQNAVLFYNDSDELVSVGFMHNGVFVFLRDDYERYDNQDSFFLLWLLMFLL